MPLLWGRSDSVAEPQKLCDPTAGASGAGGLGLITTLFDGNEEHPEGLVTVNVNVVPAERPDTVVVDLLPVLVTVPVLPVPMRVHVPDDGRPLKATDPVADEHVGWVIVPITGAAGNDS